MERQRPHKAIKLVLTGIHEVEHPLAQALPRSLAGQPRQTQRARQLLHPEHPAHLGTDQLFLPRRQIGTERHSATVQHQPKWHTPTHPSLPVPSGALTGKRIPIS